MIEYYGVVQVVSDWDTGIGMSDFIDTYFAVSKEVVSSVVVDVGVEGVLSIDAI